MSKQKVLTLIAILVLIGLGVYTFFYTSESQSREVRTENPQKAQMIRDLHKAMESPGGATSGSEASETAAQTDQGSTTGQ